MVNFGWLALTSLISFAPTQHTVLNIVGCLGGTSITLLMALLIYKSIAGTYSSLRPLAVKTEHGEQIARAVFYLFLIVDIYVAYWFFSPSPRGHGDALSFFILVPILAVLQRCAAYVVRILVELVYLIVFRLRNRFKN